MKNNEIVIFSVSSTITQRIANVLIERKLDIPVYEFHYSDVLEKADEMIRAGTKIIISRGGTAALLRSNMTIPVIEIAHDFHGVYRILQEAKHKSQKIAAIGFPQFCNALRHYQNMTNEEFKICQVYNHYDIENVVKNLAENDYQLVIGGLTVAEMAKKYGLNAVMGDTDNISIEQAINEAWSLLKYINQENTKLLMSQSALNQSREGIMCIDQMGEVISVNATGMTLFQCHPGDKLFKKEAFKDLYGSIINEISLKEQPTEINGNLVYVSIKHFANRRHSFSIITGLSQDNALWHSVANKKANCAALPRRITLTILSASRGKSLTSLRKQSCAPNMIYRSISPVLPGRGKSFSPRAFITIAHAAIVLLSPSIARPSRKACWKANCLAMPMAHLPTPVKAANPAFSKWRKTARCSLMKSAKRRYRCR